MLKHIADGLFGFIIALWLGLSVWFGYSYVRPGPRRKRRSQTLVLAAASLFPAAFMAREQKWLPLFTVSGLEAIALVFGILAAAHVYLWEIEGGGARR